MAKKKNGKNVEIIDPRDVELRKKRMENIHKEFERIDPYKLKPSRGLIYYSQG